MSCSVRHIPRPTKKALFNTFLCVRQAAFGVEVVPDVNWMVAVSWLLECSRGSNPCSSLDLMRVSYFHVLENTRSGAS